MYTLTVNGKQVSSKEDKKLLDFLRDNLRLISVKDGCSEGACGTCTVLIDGKIVKACTKKLSKLQDKDIVTVEGLSSREKEVYVHCFAEAGAVQCGYCIPGMIMSAKSLLDVNSNPLREDVKRVIKGNICRCTGYVKIEDAILMAAKFFRENISIPKDEDRGEVSKHFKRVDAKEKVLGSGEYVDDIVLPGMIYAKALRSKYPRARVNKIDISKALLHEDVVTILLAKDVPNNKLGHIVRDWDVLIAEGDCTRYIGDALAIIATNHKETLNEVIDLVDVDYTELKPITCPKEALEDNAPLIHEKGNILKREYLKRGNADEVIKKSKYVVTKKYKTPFTEHAFMEPECAIAMPEGDDGLLLYTASQSVYDERHEIAHMLGIEEEKVHCQSKLVGGGFGGKEDMSVQHHAALVAWHTKKAVKVKFSRQESLNCHTKRHPMEMEFTTACDENGYLTAMKATIIADTGAYASLGGPVLQRACTHAAGPYNYQTIHIEGMAIYTNNIPSGAFRGFGVTQSCFAIETNINLLAEMVGISPWEFRYKNAIRPGQSLPNGQIADDSCALVQCLEALKDVYDTNKYAGIACAFKNSGIGVGLEDIGRCKLSIENGNVHIRTSAACMGQGLATMCTHMVCETTGLLPSVIVQERPDTVRTPNAGTSTASRQTVLTGEATRIAAKKLKVDLDLKKSLKDLEGKEYYGEYSAITDPMDSTKINPVSHVSYSYGAQVVILKENGEVDKIVAANDIGTVINPKGAEGQVEGGVVMGLGYALTEDFPMVQGYPTAKFGTLGLMRATQIPEIEVVFVQGKDKIKQAYGAKGVGELCLVPTAPAVAHAYYRFDGELRTSLPLKKTFYKK